MHHPEINPAESCFELTQNSFSRTTHLRRFWREGCTFVLDCPQTKCAVQDFSIERIPSVYLSLFVTVCMVAILRCKGLGNLLSSAYQHQVAPCFDDQILSNLKLNKSKRKHDPNIFRALNTTCTKLQQCVQTSRHESHPKNGRSPSSCSCLTFSLTMSFLPSVTFAAKAVMRQSDNTMEVQSVTKHCPLNRAFQRVECTY